MMDDFLLKWQLCCVSAILVQHKCTGRLLWLFNCYHCGKWISNLWQAISGWQGTFGLFLSFSFPPSYLGLFSFFFFLLFLLIFANLTKDAQWSFADIYLKQWNKEQNHTFLAPTSPLEPMGVRPGRAEQNEQSPVTTFPPHHCPHSRVAWKLKYPLVYLQLSSALVKNTYTKHNLCARIWYPAQWFVSKILIRSS